MQNFIDALNDIMKQKRSNSQMTLSDLISKLESYPSDKQIEYICNPHSYRGYYSDLAFEKSKGTMTCESLLTIINNEVINKQFIGYKGGVFHMNESTPVWISNYGDLGIKIIDIIDGDILLFKTQEDEI